MTLWLVRHATPLVEAGVCYGVLDVAADAAATAAAAQALARVLPVALPVRVSPLQRCEQLAQALQGLRPDLTFRTDACLREMDFGCWEGVAWDAIPRAAVDAWTQDFGRHRFGGQESANDVLARVAPAWDQAAAVPCAWITHAGVIRAALLLAQGQRQLERPDQWPRQAPGFGEWTMLQPGTWP